jgi:serine/threonine protein phosphatase 1
MHLTYAIGDIHGRDDLLASALDWIDSHGRGEKARRIVFLGDYVDRGPNSAAVIARLMEGPLRSQDRYVCLRGNHEQMLLDAQTGADGAHDFWLANGGKETLASYSGALPANAIEWMSTLPLSFNDARRFFVHAGVRPGLPLCEQSERDMLWIRQPFLTAEHDFGLHVVHGQTPDPDGPDLRVFRSNLDTGAVWTDRLCVAVFHPDIPGGPVEIHMVTV